MPVAVVPAGPVAGRAGGGRAHAPGLPLPGSSHHVQAQRHLGTLHRLAVDCRLPVTSPVHAQGRTSDRRRCRNRYAEPRRCALPPPDRPAPPAGAFPHVTPREDPGRRVVGARQPLMTAARTGVVGADHRMPAIAYGQQRLHNDSMAVQITVRNVPEAVRDELAARAVLAHKSMQEYLRGELARLASRPSIDRWLERVGARQNATGTRLPASAILRHLDAGRR